MYIYRCVYVCMWMGGWSLKELVLFSAQPPLFFLISQREQRKISVEDTENEEMVRGGGILGFTSVEKDRSDSIIQYL